MTSVEKCVACGRPLGHYGPVVNKNEHMTCAVAHDPKFAEEMRKGYSEWHDPAPAHIHVSLG